MVKSYHGSRSAGYHPALLKGCSFSRARPTESMKKEESMNLQRRDFLLGVTLAAAVAVPALAQTVTSGVATADGTTGAASIPDLSGAWNHPAFPWFEPPTSGPGPITNRSRWPQLPQTLGGSVALPPTKEGVSN